MKTDRLVSIIMVLLEKRRVSAKELADMFEVSVRTIYRDIEAISLSGVPVYATPGVGGGIEITDNYKVDNKVFSDNDISALLAGLSSVSGVIPGKELVNALAKVKSFIPAEKAKMIELKASQVHVDFDRWMGNKNIKVYLEMIRSALESNNLIGFEYIDHKGRRSERTAEPCQLVLKGSNWYIWSFCRTRRDYRLFKLSSISNLRILSEKYEPRDFVQPELKVDESRENGQLEVKIRIHVSVVERVLEYQSFDHFTPDGEEHYIVSLPFMDNDFYYDVLLSFGNKCECLEPPEFRQKMIERIEALRNMYKA